MRNSQCQSFFFNKATGLACNFTKKEALAQVFSCEFCKIFKNTFFTEHFWVTIFVFYKFFTNSYVEVLLKFFPVTIAEVPTNSDPRTCNTISEYKNFNWEWLYVVNDSLFVKTLWIWYILSCCIVFSRSKTSKHEIK